MVPASIEIAGELLGSYETAVNPHAPAPGHLQGLQSPQQAIQDCAPRVISAETRDDLSPRRRVNTRRQLQAATFPRISSERRNHHTTLSLCGYRRKAELAIHAPFRRRCRSGGPLPFPITLPSWMRPTGRSGRFFSVGNSAGSLTGGDERRKAKMAGPENPSGGARCDGLLRIGFSVRWARRFRLEGAAVAERNTAGRLSAGLRGRSSETAVRHSEGDGGLLAVQAKEAALL